MLRPCVEVDEGVAGPEPPAQLLAGDQLAGGAPPAGARIWNGLSWSGTLRPMAAQLAGAEVHFEGRRSPYHAGMAVAIRPWMPLLEAGSLAPACSSARVHRESEGMVPMVGALRHRAHLEAARCKGGE